MSDSTAPASTVVTFAEGGVRGDGQVLRIAPLHEGAIVVVDSTPFHPVDHTWPDQPGDTGAISLGSDSVTVVDAVMAAVSEAGELAVGEGIPVKRGASGWTWLVGHRISVVPDWLAEGTSVRLDVDAERRAALSRGHTACHLASLALDASVADLWRKEIDSDPLGNPDLEGRANQSSRIHADGSVDEYRLGKSLRKAGFDSEMFASSLATREKRINELLAGWVAAGGESRIDVDGPTIADRRRWRCTLPDGDVDFLCGGTHVGSLGDFASITVALELADPQTLTMTTTAVAAH